MRFGIEGLNLPSDIPLEQDWDFGILPKVK
jgi:hypothetical protein